MYKKSESKDGRLENNPEPVSKFLGEAAFENSLDKDCGKHRVHEKPGMRALIADITDAVMPNMVHEANIKDYQGRKLIMHEKPEPRDGMLKTKPKEIKMV